MTTSPSFPAPPAPTTPALDRFFTALRRSPVRRSSHRVVAGVCAGVAERLGVAPAIVRVAAVIAVILGPGALVYLFAWLLLPHVDGSIRLEQAVRGGDGTSIALVVVTALAVVPALAGPFHHGWPLALLAAAAVFVALRAGRGRRHGYDARPQDSAN